MTQAIPILIPNVDYISFNRDLESSPIKQLDFSHVDPKSPRGQLQTFNNYSSFPALNALHYGFLIFADRSTLITLGFICDGARLIPKNSKDGIVLVQNLAEWKTLIENCHIYNTDIRLVLNKIYGIFKEIFNLNLWENYITKNLSDSTFILVKVQNAIS